ncbi:hypothetical protein QFZ24_000792 [Streptomyces phaeochromogenes]|nr:hypothetical protein [Streptomyces phaeochromogenes]
MTLCAGRHAAGWCSPTPGVAVLLGLPRSDESVGTGLVFPAPPTAVAVYRSWCRTRDGAQ